MYRLVLFSHVLGAILSVGPAMTYGIWLGLSRRMGPAEEAFAFRGVLWMDSHLVTPAFGWQLASGLLLVFAFDAARLTDLWLQLSLMLYGVLVVIGAVFIGPRARRALRVLEEAGPEAEDYASYRRNMRRIAPIVSVATLAIVFLMVVRPG